MRASEGSPHPEIWVSMVASQVDSYNHDELSDETVQALMGFSNQVDCGIVYMLCMHNRHSMYKHINGAATQLTIYIGDGASRCKQTIVA